MKKHNAILKYPGAKWRIAEWIISHFPEHKVYLEPYFGSGAVFFKKEPCYIETVNDINGDIVNLFRVCRDFPEELAKLINLTPFSRDEFIDCYERSEDPIEQARRTIVRYHQSFGTCNSSKKSWRNVQQYGGPRCATMWNNLPEKVIKVCSRIKNAQIENTDALTLIKRYDNENTLIYCDPPYLQSLRKRNMYKHEMSDIDHLELITTLKSSSSKIILSGYENDLYDCYLRDWNKDSIETTAQLGKKRTETIWMNF
ncbi:MAG: DNA adenine methylase [Clostridia bacterium]|nr:DNA adenine methylase [Clostridia bacterium]